MPDTAVLLVTSPDQIGLVARMSDFVAGNGGNILEFDQFTDLELNTYLARIEWALDGFRIPREQIAERFTPLADQCHMHFELHFSEARPRIAIFVSRQPHCLLDLLSRHAGAEFRADMALVVGNHAEVADIPAKFGVPFHHFPITNENKLEQERKQLELLRANRIELIVLARYMQVLGGDFINAFPHSIINIHHSFLPAFAGSKPYHQAFLRGVKLIGATAHYATSELDEGPIIEQEVIRVSHRDTVRDLVRKGRDVEKIVLGRSVRLHLEHRVLTYANKTVVFD